MEMRERVDCPAKVLKLHDDEVTEYAILSHRWGKKEVAYDEIVELAKMDKEKRDEIRQRDGYQKILDSCKRAEKDGTSGCGWTLAVSTNEAVLSSLRPSIPCTGGMKTPKYAMCISTTFSTHPFPLRLTMRGMPTAGRSGSHVGGRCRR